MEMEYDEYNTRLIARDLEYNAYVIMAKRL